MSILEMVFIALVSLLALLVWFYINRASVRANEQIGLLHEIIEQQRQQVELLKKLVPQDARSESAIDAGLTSVQDDDDTLAFKNVIPER